MANAIVTNDTNALISQANTIVDGCTGTNCNTSDAIRTQITQQLSILAQNQSSNTLSSLSISSLSPLGREIYESYLNLGSSVASVYNFQCGDNPANSFTCVNNASIVQTSQNNLQQLLNQPANNKRNNIIISSVLIAIIVVLVSIFFIYLLIGLFDKSSTIRYTPLNHSIKENASTVEIIPVEENIPIIENNPIIYNAQTEATEEIALPVAPF